MNIMNITQVKQRIGQFEASITAVEEHLNDEEFKDFCDSVYIAITHLRIIQRRIKQNEENLA